MDDKLWDLRLKVISAYEKFTAYKAIKSTEDKISGYTDRGILMNPEAMQNTIALLEKDREANEAIVGFGRSKLKVKTEEEEQEEKTDNILSQFGRSICTTEDQTALERIELIEKQKKVKGKSQEVRNFINAMQELEEYMNNNSIEHSFRCKNEKLSDEDIDNMVEEAELLDIDEYEEKIKILRNINKMKNQSLFEFCDKKPYQCLVCPYYYKDFIEFTEMKKKKKKNEVDLNEK